MLPYVKVYRDFIDIVRELDNGARGRLFMAIMQYANNEEPDNLTGAEKIAFLTIKSQIDRDRDAYDDISDKRKRAGKNGAERRWGQNEIANAILPLANDSKNGKCYQDKDKEEEKEKDKEGITPLNPPKGGVDGFMKQSFKEFANGNSKLLTALNDYAAMRKRIKKPIATEQTVTRMLEKLKNEFTPVEWIPVLNQSTDRCWQDIYPLKASSKYITDSAEQEPQELPGSIRRK